MSRPHSVRRHLNRGLKRRDTAARDAFHRSLHCEPLEERALLSVGATPVLGGLYDDPVVTVTAPDSTAGEPSDNATFRISRDTTNTGAIKVYFSLWGSSATRSTTGTGGDYCLKKGTTILTDNSVTIDADHSYVDITVATIDDLVHESTETVQLTLQAGTGYGLGVANTSASISITDDDAGGTTLPSLTIEATNPAVSEPSGTSSFKISRTGSTTAALTAHFAISGDADNTIDYSLSTGTATTVTIPAGSSYVNVALSVIDDTAWESSENVTLTLTSNSAYNIGTNNAATIQITDDDATVVSVTANGHDAAQTPYAANESAGSVTFTFTRDGDTSSDITVGFDIGGSATIGTDYTLSTGSGRSVVIAAGQTTATVTMTINDDSTSEATETVILTLSDGSSTTYEVGWPPSATINLMDNDPVLVTVAALDSTAGEPNNNGSFRVSRTGDVSTSLTVNLAMAGDAVRGTDYTLSITGTTFTTNAITIGAGLTYRDIVLTVVDDTEIESTEMASVTVQSGTGYEVGISSSVAIAITDDDSRAVTITATDATASEPSSNGTFRITRTGPTNTSLIVAFALGGTATPNQDYTLTVDGATLTSNYVTIAAGQTGVDITVTVINDTTAESAETVIMTLTDGTDVGTSATVIIADDDSPRQSVIAQNVYGVAGQAISIPVQYTVSTNDNTLSGLGLRLFFSSDFMTYNSLSNVLQTGLISQQTPISDSNNLDKDDRTDSYIVVAWVDLAGNWPNQSLPTTLFTANFTVGSVTNGEDSVVNFLAASNAAGYSFDPVTIIVQAADSTLDIDGDTRCDALTDGVLIMRYLFDPNGSWTTTGAVNPNTHVTERTTHDEVKTYLDSATAMLDVDDNGVLDALTDGMLIMRYLFDPDGSWSIDGLVGDGANRTSKADIQEFLDNFWVDPPVVQGAPSLSHIDDTSLRSALSGLLPSAAASTVTESAKNQIVTPSAAALSVVAGAHATFDVNYSTNPTDATLSGLGLRMYYNSSRLTFNGLSNVLTTSQISNQPPVDDTNDGDGDPNTDKYVLVAWADLSGNWPGTQSQRLFTADFTVNTSSTAATKVNFGATSTAAGWTFAATPVTITSTAAAPSLAPKISSVVVVTAKNTISWNALDADGIAGSTVKIDGKKVSKIYGPSAASSGVNYAGVFSKLSAGRHTYVITATDKKGHSSSLTGTFSVVATANYGPSIGSVAVSSTKKSITWNAADADGVAGSSLKIDGKKVSKIYGPYAAKSGVNFAGAFNKPSAGHHTYVITATDKKGHSSSFTGTFDVLGIANVGPAISYVVVNTASGSITWNVADADGIASSSLKVDGIKVSKVYGPSSAKSGVNYSGTLGTLAAGMHNYVITATDKTGHTSTMVGSFTVASKLKADNTSTGVRAVFSQLAAQPKSSAKVDWLYDDVA